MTGYKLNDTKKKKKPAQVAYRKGKKPRPRNQRPGRRRVV